MGMSINRVQWSGLLNQVPSLRLHAEMRKYTQRLYLMLGASSRTNYTLPNSRSF